MAVNVDPKVLTSESGNMSGISGSAMGCINTVESAAEASVASINGPAGNAARASFARVVTTAKHLVQVFQQNADDVNAAGGKYTVQEDTSTSTLANIPSIPV